MAKEYEEDINAKLRREILRLERRVAQLNRFQNGIRSNGSNYVKIPEIVESRMCCPSAPAESLDVCTYPFYHSPKFQTLIQVRCRVCGTAWVPSFDFSLDDYYRSEYAEQVQPFRKDYTGAFFDTENPFWQTQTADRMVRRAERHLSLLDVDEDQTLLDIGPGVGITLWHSGTTKRLAAELDQTCHATLTEEVGARLVDLSSPDTSVDSIIASHVVEHLPLMDLQSFFDKVRRWAKPGARMLIEVPQGALHAAKIEAGERGKLPFEPHVISFSSTGLGSILQTCGLELLGISVDKLTSEKYFSEFERRFKNVEIIEQSPIVALCRFP